MNPVPLFLIIVTLPLLLGGCGEKVAVEPVVEVKPVEEKVLEVKEEVKPEEPVAEAKPELEGVNDKAIVGKWEGQGIIGIFNEDGTCEALSNGKTIDTGT